MEVVKWIVVLVLGAAVGYFAHDYVKLPSFTNNTKTVPDTMQNTNTDPCAQVITMARDPKSGDLKQFKTPCDVPKGWEVIENDIPGIDLQPQ